VLTNTTCPERSSLDAVQNAYLVMGHVATRQPRNFADLTGAAITTLAAVYGAVCRRSA
jgi:hypothetical protein